MIRVIDRTQLHCICLMINNVLVVIIFICTNVYKINDNTVNYLFYLKLLLFFINSILYTSIPHWFNAIKLLKHLFDG